MPCAISDTRATPIPLTIGRSPTISKPEELESALDNQGTTHDLETYLGMGDWKNTLTHFINDSSRD